MMDMLRSAAKGWIAKVLLALLALSFIAWGIPSFFAPQMDVGVVARVGGRPIPVALYNQFFNQEIKSLSLRVGTPVSLEQAFALGLDRQTLDRLLTLETLAQQAEDLGLFVPSSLVVQKITQQDQFRGPAGEFSRERLEDFLRYTGLRNETLVDFERTRIQGSLLYTPLIQSIALPSVALKLTFDHRHEERDFEFFALTSADVPAEEISEEDLKAYYTQNSARFQTQEQRVAGILLATPEVLSHLVTIAQSEIDAYYKTHKDTYVVGEKRTFRKLVFPSLLDAERAQERLSKGASFEELLREQGEPTASLLSDLAREDFEDPKVAKALFDLNPREISAPMVAKLPGAADLEAVIVLLVQRMPPRQKSLDEVRSDIQQALRDEKIEKKMSDIHGQVEDLRGQGIALDKIAQTLRLGFVRTDGISRSGLDAAGKPLSLPVSDPFRQQVIEAVFAQEVGLEADPVSLQEEGFSWIDLERVDPPQEKTFEQAKDEISRILKAERLQKRLLEKAHALQERLQKGETFGKIAQELGVVVTQKENMTRLSANTGLDSNALAEVFRAPQGSVLVLANPDDQTVRLLRVTKKTNPPFNANQEDLGYLKTILSDGLNNDLSTVYLSEAQRRYGVSINTPLLSKMKGGVVP